MNCCILEDMYLAVDVGGSKTLVAVFSQSGDLLQSAKLKTPKNYSTFLKETRQLIKSLGEKDFAAIAIAAPGKIDRKRGIALDFGNLPWHNSTLREDFEQFASSAHTPVLVENDANLAGLSEASLVKDKYKKVLYLTVSTGIGDGIIVNGQIDPVFADSEAGQMVLEHDGKIQKWEDFASGRALAAKYGMKASEINDSKIWQQFVRGLALGIGELIATITPEVIILGGGVGAHYEKFNAYLQNELQKYKNNLYEIPPIIKAKRPEEAVIYGCYELIRQSI